MIRTKILKIIKKTRPILSNFFLGSLILTGIVIVFLLLQREDQTNPQLDEKDITTQRSYTILKKDDDYTCFYSTYNDSLPVLDKTMTFPPNSIFFIESTCKGLTSRQACAVESAARANPDRQVNMLFTSPVTWDMLKDSGISVLLSITNVEAARILIQNYADDTPVHAIFKKTPLTPQDLNVNQINNILKYLTIYKYSGTYLAMDVMVARSFDNLKSNWIVKETSHTISTEMFSFSNNKYGRDLADMVIRIVASIFERSENKELANYDTPKIMKKLLHLWCVSSDKLDLDYSNCEDLDVMEPTHFLPIPFSNRRQYFKPLNFDDWKKKNIYTYHTWEFYTKYHAFNEDSLYGSIAKEYCPYIYEFFGDKFGNP